MQHENEIAERTGKKDGSKEQRFLAFALSHEEYAVPLLKVREVIALNEITKVPYTPAHFKGIMNLRGQVISVIDLRVKFNMASAEIGAETAIVILDLNPICLGVIVDSVDAVLAMSQDQISPSPNIESSINTEYIVGVARVEKKLVLILDIEKTLSVDDLKVIKNQTPLKQSA
ncbi:MAG: chemotaxis protein CheW [Oligoflexus sp.]